MKSPLLGDLGEPGSECLLVEDRNSSLEMGPSEAVLFPPVLRCLRLPSGFLDHLRFTFSSIVNVTVLCIDLSSEATEKVSWSPRRDSEKGSVGRLEAVLPVFAVNARKRCSTWVFLNQEDGAL